jgi:hypothetical protein
MLNLLLNPLSVIMRPGWAFCHRVLGEMPQSWDRDRTISPAAESPAAATVATTVSADPQASQADLTASAAISNSAAPAPLSESEQRVQDMQSLFQQRKQMIEDARKPPAN